MKYLLFILFFPFFVHAEIMLNGSRVIINHSDRESSILVKNTGKTPVVIQSWVDNGDPSNTPETVSDIPALTIPAIFRLDPEMMQQVRIINKFIPEFKDKESLYWLNLYEINPIPENKVQDRNTINVAVRLQIKVFMRPDDLKMDISKVSNEILFSLDKENHKLTVNNPTPFYVTFESAFLTDKSKKIPIKVMMLSPFSSQVIAVENTDIESINYSLIDDIGSHYNNEKSLIH